MKVVHVIPSVARRYGGPQRVVRDLSASLSTNGHEVSVVTTDLDGPERLTHSDLAGEFPADVEICIARTVRPRGYALAPSLPSALRRQVRRADLVHVHGVYQYPNWVASRIASSLDVPYVCHPHGALTAYHRGQKRWKKRPYEFLVERRNLRRAEAIIVMTDLEESDFQDWMPGARTVLIPPSLDAALFQSGRSAATFPPSWGIPGDRRVVSFIGRFTEKKGLDLLVDAFALLYEQTPSAHLVLAGPDDEGLGEEIAARIRRRGLEERVSIVGLVSGSEKTALLTASDVVALPSKDESFGVAVAEALAVGTPVVVSPQVGLSEAVEAEQAGLVAERKPTALANALGRIIRDRELHAAMSKRGRRFAEASFAPGAVSRQVEALYMSAAASRS